MRTSGKCRLCLEEAALVKSHIYPEFLYREMYDEIHKYRVVSTKEDARIKRPPIGRYERIMCAECEGKTERFDNYAANVLRGKCGSEERIGRVTLIRDIDYQLFKLFQISILWRCAVSSLEEFSSVSLGKHEDRMRVMIYNEDPGRALDYPCFVMSSDMPDEMAWQLIMPPIKSNRRIDSHTSYSSIFAGLLWVWIVSSHSRTFPHGEFVLSESGNLPIPDGNQIGMNFIKSLAMDLKRKGMLEG